MIVAVSDRWSVSVIAHTVSHCGRATRSKVPEVEGKMYLKPAKTMLKCAFFGSPGPTNHGARVRYEYCV